MLIILLLVSTGPLLLSLVIITTADFVALSVAIIRLLANGLPCLSLLLVLYDAILSKQMALFGLQSSPASSTNATPSDSKSVSYLQLLTGIFISFYAMDLVVYMICTSDNHESYRYVSFNVQIFLSTLYLIKPWLWAQLDLRDVAAKFEKFYLLALKVTQALIELLNNVPRGQATISPAQPGPASTESNSAATIT